MIIIIVIKIQFHVDVRKFQEFRYLILEKC
jgi:hypothetical protein